MIACSPVGTAAQRRSGRIWPGAWFDATGFARRYKTDAVGWSLHTGVDLNLNDPTWNADKLADVVSVADGVVHSVTTHKTWGRIIIVKHDPDENGQVWVTRYAHVTNVVVNPGDKVKMGDKLCQIGDADGQQPWHLHFDVSGTSILLTIPNHWPGLNEEILRIHYVDPLAWLRARVVVTTPTPTHFFGTVNVSTLNIRELPTTASSVVGTLSRGDRIEVSEVDDAPDWLRYHRSDGREFFVWRSYVTREDDGEPVPDLIVYTTATPSLRVRSQPNTTSEIKARLSRGTKITVRVANADWWYVPSYDGYVSRAYTSSVPPQPVWRHGFDATKRGLHLSAGGWHVTNSLADRIKVNNIAYALAVTYEPNETQAIISAVQSGLIDRLVIRMATHAPWSTPKQFVDACLPSLLVYARALGDELPIAVHNEPNLYKEGYGTAWKDAAGFNGWCRSVYVLLRRELPKAKLGFPALSPGGAVPNVRVDEMKFAASCADAISDSDWVGVHVYWQDLEGDDFVLPVARWHEYDMGKPLLATEVGPVDNLLVTATAVRKAYALGAVAGIPIFQWVGDGAGSWRSADWVMNNVTL